MEPTPAHLDDRLARLEGQYHALSKELSAGLSTINATLEHLRQQVEGVTQIKRGLLKSESLADVIGRMDDTLKQLQRQVEALSTTVQTKLR